MPNPPEQRPPSGLPQPRIAPSCAVIVAGVVAALHVGKLAPAIPALQAALGISLVQAGVLLSVVQFAGMCTGVAVGAGADALGARRSMLIGLVVLALASTAGAFATALVPLLVLRAAEGFGFLLVVLAAPALLRTLVAPARLDLTMGVWSTFMPVATALALATGPFVIGAFGWPAWWLALAALTAAMAVVVTRAVPRPASQAHGHATAAAPRGHARDWAARLATTLRAPGPWLVALPFAMYSGQWLAVIGFLPTIYAEAGLAAGTTGMLTALAAAVNIAGNVGAGRALHRGVEPKWLLGAGFVVMALAAAAAFAGTGSGQALPAAVRFAAVLVFSGVGGLIPGTLFALALRVAPAGTASTTIGWMQQWSAAGQFVGPPVVAGVASAASGWHLTWIATGACSVAGLALGALLVRHVQHARVSAPAPRELR